MLLRTPCIPRITRTTPHHTQWRRIPVRCYTSTDSDDPPWFQQLRAEMLQRDMTQIPEHITAPHEHKFSRTLYGFLPKEINQAPGSRNPVLPIGHHLIWFNPAWPTHELLPDGTDVSQSPGGPWVRRMWAGGSIQLRPDDYYHKKRGLTLDTEMAGVERIKDVRLRGQDHSAKIFVTIERRFARLEQLKEGHRETRGSLGRNGGLGNAMRYFGEQMQQDEGWGDAILKEERNLVFMKERTTAELEAIKAGEGTAVKYLDPPGEPQFSHTLMPDRALLFRFSALTFNAHLMHLDRDYARNVEGHRNLLVHGPLSLVVMLKAISSHVDSQTDGKQVVESIEYRNLAPLYCDEEMRICGLEKKTLQNGSIYDVWIEGPTGGVAVKGTVYTTVKNVAPTPSPTPTPKAKELWAYQSKTSKQAAKGKNDAVDFRRVILDETTFDCAPKRADRSKADAAKLRAYRRVISAKTLEPESLRRSSAPNELETTELSTALGVEHVPSKTEQSAQYSASETEQPIQPSADAEHSLGEKSERPILQENIPQPTSREVAPSSVRAPGRTYRRNRATTTRSYQFITSQISQENIPQPSYSEMTRALGRTYRRNRPTRTRTYQFITSPIIQPTDTAPIIPLIDALPVRSIMSSRLGSLRRRVAPTKLLIEPIPILRKHRATPYTPDPDQTAARHSRFKKEGARKIEKPRLKVKGENLERKRRTERWVRPYYGIRTISR